MYNPTWTDVQRTINNVRGVPKFGVVKTATQSSANILTLALPCHLYTMAAYIPPCHSCRPSNVSIYTGS